MSEQNNSEQNGTGLDSSESKSTRKSKMTIIFMTIFIYLAGFGMIIPMIPVLGREYGASPTQIGLLMSVYSLMQFIFSPLWGRLSDRIGRRPVLLFCLVGETLSYIAFAYSDTLTALFITRLFAGLFGASISTASAYISDITPPHERSKGMALIGAAFGLGFIVGPALGGGLSLIGASIDSADPHFAFQFASLCVAGICFANLIFAWIKLSESLVNRKNQSTEKKTTRFQLIWGFAIRKTVGPLIAVYFLSSMSMAVMEATLILYLKDIWDWGLKEVSFGFAYVGVISAFSQGFLVRRLLPKVGERKLLLFGLIAMAISLFGISLTELVPFPLLLMGVVMTLLAVGSSFTNPATLGSISLLCGPQEQGAVMGTSQALSALGRILGPALGGYIYGALFRTAPFISGALFSITAIITILKIYPNLPTAATTPESKAP